MPTWLGIDVGSASVKAAVVRSAYRKLSIVRVASADVGPSGGVSAAVRSAVARALEGERQAVDAVAAAIDGNRAAIHRLRVPATAQRQLGDVLAYELEAQIPFDLEGAVFDWRLIEAPASGATDGAHDQLSVIAAVARIDDVRSRINLIKDAIAQEPERVGVGAPTLGALGPFIAGLTGEDAAAVVDLGARGSEVLIMERGEPVFARTLSTGTEGLPGTASRLARDIRVSFAAHRAQGGMAPSRLYLCGGGAYVSGAEGFLSGELEIPVQLLPEPSLDVAGLGDAAKDLPRYAKAVALALTLAGRGTGLNLRRGPLTFERGFSWVREKIPLLAGLAAVIVVSFAFSSWARLYGIHKERDTLTAALGAVTKEVLGTEVANARDAQDLLTKEVGSRDEDPMPHADAFDVMVRLSQAIPSSMTHDIEELDVQKGHVVVRGVVGSIPDAQSIATTLSEDPCLSDVKIKSTTQAVGSERQKYVMEFEVKCPEDVKSASKKKGDSASATPSNGAGGK
ncbi:MAG TPA: pilus assembly protein PilM [Polyangiaceae bacterium]|nr:pilus assembly protein PilM [Polyangiaceae bacterium]